MERIVDSDGVEAGAACGEDCVALLDGDDFMPAAAGLDELGREGAFAVVSPAPLWATRMKFRGWGAVGAACIGAVWVRIANVVATTRINNEEMRVSFMDGLRAVLVADAGLV